MPDAGYEEVMQLPAGTYTFVCFNDKITQNGSTLTLTRSNTGNAALLGINKNVVVSGLKQSVSFAMKHAESRMKIGVGAYETLGLVSSVANNISTTLSSLNATDVPAVANYNVATDTWSKTSGLAVNEADINNEYTSSDYHYFLPSTSGSCFKLTFTSGMVYGRNMTGRSLKLFTSQTLNMQANKSYYIDVRLHYKFTYLFSDGTTGTIAANPAKTPIGLVINRATRTAVALNDASSSALWTTRSGRQNANECSILGDYQTASGTTAYDGYNETWNAANSFDGTTVKATSTDFPAFKAAADYNPGVPTASNIGKWYLPSVGEFTKYLKDTLSLGNTVMWSSTINWAFKRAGGTGLFMAREFAVMPLMAPNSISTLQYAYCTSSEKDNDNILSYLFESYTYGWGGYGRLAGGYSAAKTQVKRVRPFVHY